MVCGEKRQIVRPTSEKYGILPGFGLFDWGLISLGTAPSAGALWEETHEPVSQKREVGSGPAVALRAILSRLRPLRGLRLEST